MEPKPASLTALPASDLYRFQVRELRDYAMFTLDPQGTIVTWNAGVEKLIGYAEPEWVGQHASIIFTPEETAASICESEMNAAVEKGSTSDIRWHLHKDRTKFFANGCMTALYDDRGTHIGFTKVISDETLRKRLEDSLTQSNAALEQFAYAASHDLQEPLRTVNVYAELLNRKYRGKLDADAEQMLSALKGASGRMSTLIQDLLAYARLTSSQERPLSLALDEDLETALTQLGEAIKESGATITHDALPTLGVEREQMVRLFQNLVGNAIKYRKPNARPVVHVTARQSGSEWIFSIIDNGIGFETQYAESIFEPFKRLHTNQAYAGNGIGLAICKRIVQDLGGRIWAESIVGQGSTFYFTLPVGRPQ